MANRAFLPEWSALIADAGAEVLKVGQVDRGDAPGGG
jgi:hypothetical protein